MPDFGKLLKSAAHEMTGAGGKERFKVARAKQADKKVLAKAQKVKGKPWWESDARTFVVAYEDLDQLNAEAQIVEDLGWDMAQTAAADGHVHLGRAFLTGGLTLFAKGGRSKGKTTVTWKRTAGE